MAEEIDFTKPGKLWATPENEAETTFHFVLPKPAYTRESLTKDPTIHPADQLMAPWTVATKQLDKQGNAVLDLEKSGRGKEIMQKLAQRIEKGEKIDAVRAIVLAKARDGNHIPDKQVAEIIDFKVVAIPTITLLGTDVYVTVQNFKAGKKEFAAELSVTGPVKEVQLTTTPASPIAVSSGQRGNGSLTVPVKEGQKLKVTVPAPFKMRGETKQEWVPRTYLIYVPWGWRTAGGRREYDPQTFTREVWDGGFVTLRAAGTGPFAEIVKSVTMNAEPWGSSWLAGPPPPPFYHNVC